MDSWEIVGITASVLSSLTLIPEVRNAIVSKHMKDVAWGMLFLLFGASCCWLTYGIMFGGHIPLILAPSINITMEITLMILKRKYDRQQELELKNSLAPAQYES